LDGSADFGRMRRRAASLFPKTASRDYTGRLVERLIDAGSTPI
jgi:hypothetical protein